MSRQVSPSTGHVYGLERVSRLWGVSRATIYRHRHRSEEAVGRRPGPQGAMADEGLVAASCSETAPFMARATASCGPGCALPASAPADAASCG